MKKYRLSSLLVTFVLALTLLAPFSALAADAPHITSRHAVLMDANYGEILYEKAAREKAYPGQHHKGDDRPAGVGGHRPGRVVPGSDDHGEQHLPVRPLRRRLHR